MTVLNQFSGIYKVFRNGAPFDEPRLIHINKVLDEPLQPSGYDLGDNFNRAILQ